MSSDSSNDGVPNGPAASERRFEMLVNRLIEGVASDIEIEQLETLLASNVQLVDSYLELTSIHSLLQWRLGKVAEPVSCMAKKQSHSAASGWARNWMRRSRLAYAVSIAAATIALVAVIGVNYWRASVHKLGTEVADQSRSASAATSSNPQSPAVARDGLPNALPPAPAVAHVARMVECRWIVAGAAPQQGDLLRAGQSLHLAEGVVSLDFDIGAKLILQGPAELSILSAKELRLERGKLAAEITSVAAHGFTVYTPQGKLVDLGTEFGVEIAPEGSSKVHVFRGKVEVSLPSVDGKPPLTTECLMANGSVRVDAGTETMNLVGDTGESYVRSLDRFKKDEHVVAYWRFEDRPLGTLAPHTNRNNAPVRATVDSSYNGNDLYAWSDETRPAFSGAVGEQEVPQTHAANRACLDNSKPVPKNWRSARNVYTHSAFSHASPMDIQKITPAKWTIEASVKLKSLGKSPQTIVGRDTEVPRTDKLPARPQKLSLEVNSRQRFAIHYYDADKRLHEAVAEQLAVQANRWYHIAAVSDGRTLKLYIDDRDGSGYQLRASKALPSTGSTALGKGADTAEWTVGRGLERGYTGAAFVGLIDEVRVSDIARAPEELLFAKRVASDADKAKSDASEAGTMDDLE